MARPRTIDDRELLAAAWRAVGRVGPVRLTLSEVARDAGVSPATLVQRFGSKRRLLLALAAEAAEDAGGELRDARANHASPLAALRAGLIADATTVADPQAFANSLAFLQVEIADPDFHGSIRTYADAVLAEIRDLLDAAVAAGELRPTGTARLARTVLTTYNGALITWAIHRRGPLARWLTRELDAVLDPYRGGFG